MGLFDIFKRKPGGTFFGNMLRGAVKGIPVVGAFLGNGGMMISQEDADKRDMSDQDFINKYGVQKDGTVPSVLPYLQQSAGAVINGALTGLGNYQQTGANATNTTGGNFGTNATDGATKSVLQQYGKIIGAFLGLGILYFILKKAKIIK